VVWKVGETGQRRRKDTGSMLWRGCRIKWVEGCRVDGVQRRWDDGGDSVQRMQDEGAVAVCRGCKMRGQ
jgi:hypothetical protein